MWQQARWSFDGFYLIVHQFGQRVQVIDVVEGSGDHRTDFERVQSDRFAVLCESVGEGERDALGELNSRIKFEVERVPTNKLT